MEDLRKQARRLENGLDAKLVQFSRLDGGASADNSGANGVGSSSESAPLLHGERVAVVLQREIEQLLSNLSEVNDQMSRQASQGTSSVTSTMHVLQRHREILHDFMQEFQKTRANLTNADEREQLLSSVRKDICDHRLASQRASDTLLRERNAIHQSERVASDVIGQAEAAKAALGAQRNVFGGVGFKLQQLSSITPQVNALIAAIQHRKRRDKLVLGALVGGCTSLLLLYHLSFGTD